MFLKRKFIIHILLLILGGAFIVYGAMRGEAGIVMDKAIKICLECVGIG